MNLLINAAEAIGKAPGVVSVRTGRQTLAGQPPPDRFLNRRVAPGEYVFLEVQDDGSGIDEQTMRRIFDPFFTTKFTGRGLGLAAVLGIVRLHNGTVQVHSVPGRGSTFRVLFLVAGKGPSPIPQTTDRDDLAGSGAILVVDDEEMIRNFTRSALRPYGYTVLSAPDGSEGVRLFQERSNDIRLVILDVAMPGMDGLAALERMRAIRPDIPVLICSGFGDVDVETRFAGMGIAGFFAKPFTVKQLARKVKECLTQPQL